MFQTRLDDFTPYTCNRCGKAFTTKKGLKVHLAFHNRNDFLLIREVFDNIAWNPNIYQPDELLTLMKAIGADTKEKTVEILLTHKRWLRLAEAVKFAYESWVRAKNDYFTNTEINYIMQTIEVIERTAESSSRPVTYVG